MHGIFISYMVFSRIWLGFPVTYPNIPNIPNLNMNRSNNLKMFYPESMSAQLVYGVTILLYVQEVVTRFL